MNKEVGVKEGMIISGEVELNIICSRTGKVLNHFTEKNLIVNLGKKTISRLIGGAGQAVNKISVGEGTTPAAVTDTSLVNAFSKNVDAVNYPADDKVRFSFSLDSGEANGLTITELGLLNNSNELFSRKVRAAIVKTSAILITGFWTITIN